MDYFAHKTGDRPIKRGDDAKIFARLIESHVCLEPGALLVRRRTPFYMIPSFLLPKDAVVFRHVTAYYRQDN